MQPDPAFELIQLVVVEDADVPLDTGVAEQGGEAAERQVGHPACRVGLGRADVGALQFGREEQPRPTLDGLALQRIVAIAGPHPLGVLEHAQIDARPTRGAGLDLQPWVSSAKLGHETVGGLGLTVHSRPTLPIYRFVQVSVVVPLDVLDADVGDDLVETGADVFERSLLGEIENLLAAPGASSLHGSVGRQQPLGVGPSQIGIEVDHLRFHPQPHLHTVTPHAVGQRSQPLGPHLGIDLPIPQSPRIVAPAREPAVVQNEPLGPDASGGVHQGVDTVEPVIEVNRLPGVHGHRARGAGVAGASTDVAVDGFAKTVQAVSGTRKHHHRRRVAFTRLQADLPRPEELPPGHDGGMPSGSFGRLIHQVHVIAAPGHVDSGHVAAAETETFLSGDHQQGGVVAGAAAP